MQKVILTLVALLIPLSAFAQDEPYMYVSTPKPTRCGNGQSCKASVQADGTQVMSGTVNVVATPGATSLLKAGQATAANTDSGVMMLGVRAATQYGPADRSSGVNKFAPFQFDAYGALITHPTLGGGGYGFGNSMRVSTADTNSYSFSSGQTNIGGFIACNTTAVAKYIKFYNKATAPTCGTDTPTIEYFIQPNTITPCATVIFPSVGTYFPSGGGYCITGAAGVTDTTAIGAGDVYVTIFTS